MKRLVPALALLLVAILLAACGGSSGSSTNNEEEWAAEVQKVMTGGEKSVESAEDKINAATTRKTLEAAYRTYAQRLSAVASQLDETEAPQACSSVKSHVVGFLQEFGSITGELGHQGGLDEKKFDALVKEDATAGQTFAGMMKKIGSKGHC
jgi:hypothetical protein